MPESILESRGGGGAVDRGNARPWSALKVSAEKALASQAGGDVCDAGGDGTAVASLLTSTSGARRTEPSSPKLSSSSMVRKQHGGHTGQQNAQAMKSHTERLTISLRARADQRDLDVAAEIIPATQRAEQGTLPFDRLRGLQRRSAAQMRVRESALDSTKERQQNCGGGWKTCSARWRAW